FEYALGVRYEQFTSTSLQKSTDSTFRQSFNNFFPSIQWKYATVNRIHSLSFNFTRRINRPSFWEVSPFLTYTDPLNLETGNPFLRPEFGYLYELTWSGSWGLLSFDLTGFRRTTRDVIQRVTNPLDENQLLVTYDNLGIRNDDGFEWNGSFDVTDKLIFELNGSTFRTQFKEENEAVFFSGRWNWQTRLKQRLQLKADWTIDISQYYRAPRYGAQSISLAQYYINASIQKAFKQKRGSITLSVRDIFNTRIFGRELVGEDFSLTNNYKFQTQVLSLSLRYKVID
ncbi:MAG: outer membrane beta-barrel family protein, partial [Bacteroidota bacterium]